MRSIAYEISVLALALTVLLPAVGAIARAGEVAAPEGAVILTVVGKINNWNRGPFDERTDSFHKHHRFTFERAITFDRKMLQELPQGEARAAPPIINDAATFKGPRLSAILDAAGVDGAETVTLIALDGYTVELAASALDAREWILALSADGTPLGIGKQGLLWLVHTPAKGEAPSDEEFGKWGWAIFYIEVR